MTLVEEDRHPRRGLGLLTSWTGLGGALIGRPQMVCSEGVVRRVFEHWCGQTSSLTDKK